LHFFPFMNRRIVPNIYYLLASMLSLSAFSCLFSLFRELVLFFGTHTVSTVTITAALFLCLAFGSYVCGRIADHTAHPLTFFACFALILTVISLIQPFSFNWIKGMLPRIVSPAFNGPFGFEIQRLICSFLVFLFPAGIAGGSFPLITRHLIKNVGFSGRFMSTTLFAISSAIAIDLLLFTFLGPQMGINTVSVIAGTLSGIGAILPALWFIRKIRSHSLLISIPFSFTQTVKATLRFRKKKAVIDTSEKLKAGLLRVYAFQGFSFASVLAISFRLISQYSLIDNAGLRLISAVVVLTGIMTGSLLYYRIAEKPANKFLTLATLQVIQGFVIMISYTLLRIIASALSYFKPKPDKEGFVLATHVLLIASLLFIPSVINGLSLPLAGKIYPKRLQNTGKAAGYLWYLLFICSITGYVLTLFIIVPLAGALTTYFIFATLITLSGIYLVYRDSRLIRGFRLSYALLVLGLIVAVATTFRIFRFDHNKSVKHWIEGNTASVATLAQPDSTLAVLLNGSTLLGTGSQSLREQLLPAYIPLLINPEIKSALVIGFGTGITAAALEDQGVADIHITENYPEMVKLSSVVFADMNNDIMTSNQVDLTVEDAISYLRRTGTKTDLITSGIDLHCRVPSMYTRDFYALCKNSLTEKGVFCQLIPTAGISEKYLRSIIKSCISIFPDVSLWYISREQALMVARQRTSPYPYCEWISVYAGKGLTHPLASLGITGTESLLAHLISSGDQLKQFYFESPENSNDRPYPEFLPRNCTSRVDNCWPLLLKERTDYAHAIDYSGNCIADPREISEKIARINQRMLQRDGLSSGLR
jgi:spermidine synthase